nr:type I toxin-antitoxin system Fst family toxin [Staphylococcus sp. NRL 19/737]
MLIIFVHIIAPVISGCAVAYYTYWLSKRNIIINRRLYKPASKKSPHYCE